jgi:CRISPR-associated endonuclease/helicase Cas3
MTFDAFFQAATGHAPFDYQRRLASGEQESGESAAHWLSYGTVCESKLINIPTGLGKTAAVVLAWLWNRVQVWSAEGGRLNSGWPRRLVYCLPMRTLVEQTRDNALEWLVRLAFAAAPDDETVAKARARLSNQAQERLKRDESELRWHTGELAGARSDLLWLAEHSPVILMGGEELEPERRDWDTHPERPAILIGTQDMLLSRALNRGYGMSRYRWPIHFGLLNHDALWVMDETQLMGVSLETSAQLDGFHHPLGQAAEPVLPGARAFTWWMSATLDMERLATVDHPRPADGWPTVKLEVTDLRFDAVCQRREAPKSLSPASLTLTSTAAKELPTYARQLAQRLIQVHQAGSLTLVIVNSVLRAQKVFEALGQLKPSARLGLIHSRFCAPDRERQQRILFEPGDRIVVATQAVEAGVDVSARVLITELAPWPALVQRFGRCNRDGAWTKAGEARVLWVDWQPAEDKDAVPYSLAELDTARAVLEKSSDVSPASLEGVAVPSTPVVRPILRRKDLLELFDTTPDLAGHDLDISRYIRDGEDTDVRVFWRDLGGHAPAAGIPEPNREELCAVSLPRFREFAVRLGKETDKLREKTKDYDLALGPFIWNQIEERWEPAVRIRPGATYLLDVRAGGYSADTGWTGELAEFAKPSSWVQSLAAAAEAPATEGYSGNVSSFQRTWVTLRDHTRSVVHQTNSITQALAVTPAVADALGRAALWHDVGKAHEVFQKALRNGPHQPEEPAILHANSKNRPSSFAPPDYRRFFRHELASALAWLQAGPGDQPERDLIAYLVAAHHGKVRVSIRSLPGEEPPADRPDARLARGVLDGDGLPAVELDGLHVPSVKLDLGLMEMGCDAARGPSWLARMLALRDRFGPFQLALLETLLRAADARASAAEVATPNPLPAAGVSSNVELREEPSAYGAPSLSPAEQALVAELVADGLVIQDRFRPEPLYKQTGKDHHEAKTVQEIQQAKKAKPKGGAS